jgi:hypothetical protein
MKTALLALTAATAFAAVGFAAPLAAAPIAPAQVAAHKNTHVQQAHYAPRHVRRHVRRDFRRHFWAAGPWAFRGLPGYHCHRIAHGFVCYY